MKSSSLRHATLFVLLVALGVTLRLALRDIPNFAPVAAMALFAGYLFRQRLLAIAVPLSVMTISDLFIGGYTPQMMMLVYGMLVLPAFWGQTLRRSFNFEDRSVARSMTGLMTCSLGASLLFFVATNFGAWYWFDIYERSIGGLLACYVAALPFFRYTLAGDLFFAALLFGTYSAAYYLSAKNARLPAAESRA